MHRALDLALAQQRVDGPADVVDGDDLLDAARLPVDHHELRGVAERGVDDRGARRRARRACSSSRRGTRPRSRRSSWQPPARAASHAAFTAPAPISVPRLPVVWPRPSSRVVSTTTRMRAGSTPSSCDRDLQGDGVHALAHLGPAVAHLDGPVGRNRTHGLGDLLEAVAEPGVLQPEAEADGLARGDGGVVRRADARRGRPRRRAQPSSIICPGPHTRPGLMTLRLRISHPLMPTSSASRSSTPSMANWAWLAPKPRNAPHTGLLVRTATDSHVDGGQVVRPAGVAGGPLEHLHADAGVGARVADRPDPQRRERARRRRTRPRTPCGSGGAWGA